MRVLHFSGYVDPAGREPAELLEAWPTLVDVAAGVARAGAEVTVLQAARHDAVVERHGVRFRFVAEPRYPSPRRWLGHRAAPHPWRSLQHAREEPADVIHLHGLSFPLQARALIGGGRPVLAQDHKDAVPNGWRRPVHAWGHRGLSGAAFTSRESAEPFLRSRVLPESVLLFEVPEGSTRFEPDPDVGSERLLEGKPSVLWVGHLAHGKDPLTALDAFRLFSEDHPDARLTLVFRTAPLANEIERWLEAHPGAAARVHRLGEVPHEEMARHLSAADLLLSTSLWEGSGFGVIEALACGTPVVISDIPPFRALVEGLGPALIVPTGDAAAFAEALGLLTSLISGSSSTAIRREVRAHFDRHLTFDVIGARLVEAYEEMLGGAQTDS